MRNTSRIRIGFTLAAVLAALVAPTIAQTPMDGAFTFQGVLNLSGSPVNNTADFEFALWDADSNGNQIGSAVAVNDINVVDGLFTVPLDFGVDAFNGYARWLEIGVRSPAGGGVYTTLSPRQALTPAPTALALRGLRTFETGDDTTLPDSWNVLGGHADNNLAPSASGATIAGGGAVGLPNSVNAPFGTVSGGANNTASGVGSTVAGGADHTASGDSASIGGGESNNALGSDATVIGGGGNTASQSGSTVGGGTNNAADGPYAVVAGGIDNTAGGDSSAVGGGNTNAAEASISTAGGGENNTATGESSTVGGGGNNLANEADSTIAGGESNVADGMSAAVGGGMDHVASGMASTIPGGSRNRAAGSYSLAAGFRTQANHDGAFVWADSTDADFTSTAADQFLIRAGRGVGINRNDPNTALAVNGTVTATAFIGDGSAMANMPSSDDLGDHTAIQKLDMALFDITNVGTIGASALAGDGSGLTNVVGDSFGDHAAWQALNMGTFDITNAGAVGAGAFVGDGSGLTGTTGPDPSYASSAGAPVNAVYVDDLGNVGIGTTNPTGPMQLGDAADVSAFKLSAAGPQGLVSNRDMVFDSFDSNASADNSPVFYLRRNPSQFDDSAYVDLVTITDLGRLGINTTSPGHALDVAGGARISGNVLIGQTFTGDDLYVQGSATVADALTVINGTAFVDGHLHAANGTFHVYGYEGVGIGYAPDDVAFNIRNAVDNNIILNVRPTDLNDIFQVQADEQVYVGADFSVTGSKNFVLDDPREPANRSLAHNVVEGPGYYTFYQGRVVFDDYGEAWVELPDYFEALNTDFAYLLTCVGGFAKVYVAEDVHDDGFLIAGGKPGLAVSWQVTATRNDPWAQDHPYQAVTNKSTAERGRLYYPQGYGYPKEASIARTHPAARKQVHE